MSKSMEQTLLDMVVKHIVESGKDEAGELIGEALGKHKKGKLKKEHVDILSDGLSSLIKPESLGEVTNLLSMFKKDAK